MTSTAAEPTKRTRAPIAITAAILAGLVILFFIFAGFYADVLWYDHLGFLGVLLTQWGSTVALFFLGFFAMAIPVFASIQIAYRSRPVYAKLNAQLDRYQQVVEPLRRLAMLAIPSVLGLFAGVTAAARWQSTLEWLNRTPFGTTDEQFGLDISFFVFELPFYQGAVGFASAVVLLSGLTALATSYLYGAIRVNGREVRISKSARVQVAVTAAVYLALQAVSIWLDQFSTVTSTSTGGLFTGASYTDVNAIIPVRPILAIAAAIVAVLFIVTAVVGRWRLPIIGTALLIVSSILFGSAYPFLIQRFQVAPSEKTLEEEFLQRNIDATRAAYGLSDVEEIPFDATTDAEPGALRADAATTANIRILDPSIVGPAFDQLQQFRQYYQFTPLLDVDRYTIDGQVQDTVVAVREIDQSGLEGNPSWVNTHLVYTHGYGLVAAYGNERTSDGEPRFLQSGIPSTGPLDVEQPRVYFGQNSPDYSIVGGEEGGNVEFDYPAGEGGEEETYTTFQGDGGPTLDNVFKRMIYALKFQAEEIFLADQVTNDSQILYDRDPAERVQKAAPYLTLDKDPYPSVVGGRIVWIIDGYTTSANYPYSDVRALENTIADTNLPNPTLAIDNINYIRNAVKATVDAYDGTVTLYAWDESDPILKTWQKIFPTTVKPISEMSGDLMSHVRYPSDLFKVQRAVLGEYHVNTADAFYSQQDAWTTPNDPASPNDVLQPPYYLTLQMPGQEEPSYSLYTSFIPQRTGEGSRNVLTGYLGVDSDAGSTDGERAEGYGTLRLLDLTNDDTIPGPGQVQNTFNTNTQVANQLALLQRGDTTVRRGNLLTLPVGGGLLYVQPVYVQSTGETSYPLLRKVLVAFGDDIAFEDTLDVALDTLFGGDSGAEAGDTDVPAEPGTDVDPDAGEDPDPGTDDGTETPPDTGTDTPPATGDARAQALADANTALQDREAAYRAGDLVAAAEADERFVEAVLRAIEAEQQ